MLIGRLLQFLHLKARCFGLTLYRSLLNLAFLILQFLGPFANNTLAVTGDYNTNPNHTYTTPVDSWPQISTQPPNVAAGCVGPWNKDLPLCKEYDQSEVKGAITSDVKLIVVTIGTGTSSRDVYVTLRFKFRSWAIRFLLLFDFADGSEQNC